MFELMPSGCCFKALKLKTKRSGGSFIPTAIRMVNLKRNDRSLSLCVNVIMSFIHDGPFKLCKAFSLVNIKLDLI